MSAKPAKLGIAVDVPVVMQRALKLAGKYGYRPSSHWREFSHMSMSHNGNIWAWMKDGRGDFLSVHDILFSRAFAQTFCTWVIKERPGSGMQIWSLDAKPTMAELDLAVIKFMVTFATFVASGQDPVDALRPFVCARWEI